MMDEEREARLAEIRRGPWTGSAVSEVPFLLAELDTLEAERDRYRGAFQTPEIAEYTAKEFGVVVRAHDELEAQRDAALADVARLREALTDLLDVFRREVPGYRLDSLGLEINRALAPKDGTP